LHGSKPIQRNACAETDEPDRCCACFQLKAGGRRVVAGAQWRWRPRTPARQRWHTACTKASWNEGIVAVLVVVDAVQGVA
jgi:hypothetical protein